MQLRAWFVEDCSLVGELLVRHICYIARQSAMVLQDSSAQDIAPAHLESSACPFKCGQSLNG